MRLAKFKGGPLDGQCKEVPYGVRIFECLEPELLRRVSYLFESVDLKSDVAKFVYTGHTPRVEID